MNANKADHRDENRFRFDKKISVGNLIVVAGIIMGIVSWYLQTKANADDIRLLQEKKVSKIEYNLEMDQHEAQQKELVQTIKELTKAVQNLRVEIEKAKK